MLPTWAHRRATRLLAKTSWAVAVTVATGLATRGLVTGFLEIDPAESLRSDRQAQTLLTTAGFAFLVLATVAWSAFRGPAWSVLLLGAVALGCFVSGTTEVRFMAVPVLWPAVAAATVGVLARRPAALAGADGGPVSRG